MYDLQSLAYTTAVTLFCVFFYYLNSIFALRNTTTLPKGQKICLITAHPDDECMFFSPTLSSLVQAGNAVSILCLSSGDADGLGKIREKELTRSAAFLKCKSECVNNPNLPDSMTVSWQAKPIISEIQKYVKTNGVFDAFITFDEHGVSSHPNHTSILPAIQQYRASLPQGQKPIIWKLLTTSLVRKYIGPGDAMPSLTMATIRVIRAPGKKAKKKESQMCFMSDPLQVLVGQRAMIQGHWSQMRWFRWFWILIGRYMYINELVKVP